MPNGSSFATERGFFVMSAPIREIEAGIDAVKEQTYAAGLLGQGLLEHQRMLEALLEELNDPQKGDQSMEIAERVQAELQDLQEQRDKLFQEISSTLMVGGGGGGGSGASAARPSSITSQLQFGFSPSPSFKSRDELDRLRQGKADAEKHFEAMKARVLELERKHEVFKQENWDLYVMQQQLEEKLASRSTAQSKTDQDRQRLSLELEKLRESLEQQRAQFEENEQALSKLRKQRETEDAQSRRERAGFRRNISDLHGQLRKLQSGHAPHPPKLYTHADEGEGAEGDTDGARTGMPNLQERVAFREGDHSESATAPLRGALAGHTEADDLRSKLGVALKRLGRDTQQQRKMREQIAELRKMLSNAGVTPPDQDEDDEDDGDDGDSDAWVAEDDAKPESPQPRRRLRRGQGRRILSRSDTSHHLGVPPPTAEWVDTSMGDDSVIIKEPPLDPSLADLLSGAPPAAHASRADVPAGLGSSTLR